MQLLRKVTLLAFVMLAFGITGAMAQLTGTKNIPGDYATLAAAITDLNTQGVGAGGVTLNVIAGNAQTTPAGGYVIGGSGSLVLTTASSANPITIQGNGNTVTAFSPQVAGNLNDAIFKIIGADFTTITGFNMQESVTNTVTAAATNTMTEFGVALFYVTSTDGAQDDKIIGNNIDLNRTYTNTFGIYSNNSHTATAMTTTASSTGATGANNFLKVYGNTITDVNQGVVVIGSTGTGANDQNIGLDVGGSVANANTFTNYGTGAQLTSYANVSGTVNGVLVRNATGFNVSYNSITSSVGGVTAVTLRGIYVPSFSNQAQGTFTNTVTNNTVSLRSANTTGAMLGIAFESTAASALSTFNINNNDFNTTTHTVASSGTITFISTTATALTTNINNNTFTNLQPNTTGSVTFISHSYTIPATGSNTITGNQIVTGFNKTGAGGTVTGTTTNGSSPNGTTQTTTNNNFSNITVTGATAITGISNTDGTTGTTTKIITGNTLSQWTGGTSAILGMTVTYVNGASSISNNTLTNITGQTNITGINIGSSLNAGNPLNVSLNTITGLSSTGTGGTVTGITTTNTSPLININGNAINTLSSTGASAVTGIAVNGAATTVNVFKNKIYNLSGSNAGTTVNGLTLAAGVTVNAYNNRIGDLRATAATSNTFDVVRGINVTSTTTNSSVNVSFNTVYLNASSTGGTFSTSALFATGSTTATTATLNLRNNILYNTSTPGGVGTTVAYRRSGGTTNANYGTASNNNAFYAGTPSATNLIYTDATNSFQTLPPFKAFFAPRESASVTENVNFLSTSGASADFLKINAATPTQLESGGISIAGITDDFDGDTRGTPPDIGSDEFAGTPVDLNAPTITYTNLGNTTLLTNRTLSVTITDATGVNQTTGAGGLAPRIYYKRSSEASYVSTQCVSTGGTAQNGTYDCTIDYSLLPAPPLAAGDVIQYFVVAQDTAATPNVGANPSAGFAATDVNNVTSPPTTPNSYTILAAFPATVNVGAGETYTSLTNNDAQGLFLALNNGVLNGSVTVNITSDLTIETGAVALNQFAEEGAGAGTFTVTIKPSGAARVVSGAAASAVLIRLNGASRVTFDGSLSGGTDRSLTFENTSATASGVFRFGSVGTTPITNNVLKNCIVRNGVNTSSAITVVDTAGSAAGYFNNITIQNNDVQRAFRGIFVNAIVSGTNGSGTLITGNTLNTSGANSIRLNPIFVAGANGVSVTNNVLGNISNANAEIPVGIILSTGTNNATVSGNTISSIVSTSATTTASASGILVSVGATATSINVSNNTISTLTSAGTSVSFYGIGVLTSSNVNVAGNTVSGMTQTGDTVSFGIVMSGATNGTVSRNSVSAITSSTTGAVSGINLQSVSTGVTVDRNRVFNIKNTNNGGYGANGIQLGSTSTAANTTIRNNFIYDVAGYGYAPLFGLNDNGYGIIAISGAGYNVWNNSVNMNTNQTAAGNAVAFNITSGVTAAGAIDLRNNIFANTQTAGNTRYAIYSGNSSNLIFSAIDYNDYYTTGTALGFIGVERVALSDIQAGFGSNLNSEDDLPVFVSPTDLHLQATSTLLGEGVAIAGVTNDYDNDPRPATAPDIGADEVIQSVGGVVPAGTFYNASFVNGDTLGGNVTVTNTLTISGVSSTGGNTLTIDCNGSVSGAGEGNYVDGNVKKNFCAPGSFSYPVGEGGYSPVLVTADGATTFPAGLTIDAVDGVLTGLNAATSVTRSWQLTEDGALSATLAFTYRQEDVQGTPDETTFNLYRNPGTLTFVASTTDAGTNTTTSSAPQTEFSPWGIGFAPTTASVEVGGRVREANGRGISRARVVMVDQLGNTRTAFTNSFGYYRFTNVPAGSTYIFSATHRRYQFASGPQVRTINATADDINFTSTGANDNFRPEATFFERAPFDFDGDGKTDQAVFRSSENVWYIKRSQNNTLFAQEFGAAGDRLAPADFDGDGKTDLAVFRPSEGVWYIWQSATNAMRAETFGAAGDVLVPADFDRDGKADLSAWNELDGTWRVKLSTDNSIVTQKMLKGKGDLDPIAADRDGDGKADFIFFNRTSGAWTIHTSGGATIKEQFGQAGDRAAVGDFDGDGLGDLAVYRATDNDWTIRFADGKELTDLRTAANSGVPALGDFDGDGKYDAANFGGGIWSILQSVNEMVRQHQFGLATDTVIPSIGK